MRSYGFLLDHGEKVDSAGLPIACVVSTGISDSEEAGVAVARLLLELGGELAEMDL